MNKSKISLSQVPYEGTIESVYDGLLESVRRVDNFPKPKIENSKESIDVVLELIDNKLSEYRQDYKSLTLDDGDLEVGYFCGYIDALEHLEKSILKVKNKGG